MGFEEIASVFLWLLCENGDQFWSQDKWFINKTFLLKKIICLKNLFIFKFWDNWDLHTIMRNNSEILCAPKSCLTVIVYHKQDFTLTQSIGLAHIHQFACTWACIFTVCTFLSCVDSCAHHSQIQSSPSQGPPRYPFITTATHLTSLKVRVGASQLGPGWNEVDPRKSFFPLLVE